MDLGDLTTLAAVPSTTYCRQVSNTVREGPCIAAAGPAGPAGACCDLGGKRPHQLATLGRLGRPGRYHLTDACTPSVMPGPAQCNARHYGLA